MDCATFPTTLEVGAPRPAFADVVAMFEHAVTVAPDTVALVHLGRRLTYAEEARAVAALAAGLVARGAGGRVVALAVANSIEYHVGFLACLRAGAVPALINATFPADPLRPLLADARPALALATPDQAGKIAGLGAELGFETLVLGEGALALEALVAAGDPSGPRAAIDPDQTAVLMFSGGTTGVSKGIRHTHRRLMAKVERIEWGWPTRPRGEVWLPVAPFFHVYGLLMGLLNPLYGAATVVIPERFQPDLVVAMLAEHKVTVFGGGPPAIYNGLLAATCFATSDLSALRVCPGGGAPFPVEVIRRWKAATGLGIHEGYGMTEIAPIAINTDAHGTRYGSVGKPVPDTVVEVVDLVSGTRVLPPGEAGEIRVRGPHMFEGYVDRPEETASAIRDGFVYTGDIGVVDTDGFVTITDRKKDVIFVNGFNVFPREIEEVLITCPTVRMVGVVGTNDDRTGEKAVAFVVPGDELDAGDLKAYCKSHLAPYKVPADIRIVDALPLTPAGKLDRLALIRAAKGLDD